MLYRLLAIFYVFIVGCFAFAAPIHKPYFLYEVDHNGQKSWLFGTVHSSEVSVDDFHQLPEIIQQVKSVFVEVDPYTRLNVPTDHVPPIGERPLNRALTSEAWQRLRKYYLKSDPTGRIVQNLKVLKPGAVAFMWMHDFMNETVGRMQHTISQEAGRPPLDISIVIYARSLNKRTVSLNRSMELLDYAAKTVSGLEFSQWILEYLTKDGEPSPDALRFEENHEVNQLQYKQYLSGEIDLQLLNSGLSDGFSNFIHYRHLGWVDEIEKQLKKEPTLIAVGTSHLLGEKGILEILIKRGISVRRMFSPNSCTSTLVPSSSLPP